jgi:hypothetical protein
MSANSFWNARNLSREMWQLQNPAPWTSVCMLCAYLSFFKTCKFKLDIDNLQYKN